MIDWEPIPMPNEEERRRAVRTIVDEGLPPPAGRFPREIPLSVLFFGVGDCLFLAVLITGLCFVPLAVAAFQKSPLAPLLFLLSPLLYASLQVLTMWKEFATGTLEWKQTCRIPFRVLTALRMLVFGGVSVAVCVPADVLLWELSLHRAALPWMLGVSFSSLFLYAALSLSCQRFRQREMVLAAPALWLALGAILLCWEEGAVLLLRVPALVFFLLALAGLALFLRELKHDLIRPIEGGLRYAVR